jgi:hypothetical protein
MHMATADWIWQQINACDPSDPKQFRRYRTLGTMASRETRAMLSLMTKLRLLPTRAQAMAAAAPPSRPWEWHV